MRTREGLKRHAVLTQEMLPHRRWSILARFQVAVRDARRDGSRSTGKQFVAPWRLIVRLQRPTSLARPISRRQCRMRALGKYSTFFGNGLRADTGRLAEYAGGAARREKTAPDRTYPSRYARFISAIGGMVFIVVSFVFGVRSYQPEA